MKIQVKILDEDGKVVAEHEADACQPSMWRASSNQKLRGEMPRLSDQVNNGTYELFGITFQPHVRVDRPNGWVASSPGLASNTQPVRPVNGLQVPQNFPSSLMGMSAPQKQTTPTTGRAPGLRG